MVVRRDAQRASPPNWETTGLASASSGALGEIDNLPPWFETGAIRSPLATSKDSLVYRGDAVKLAVWALSIQVLPGCHSLQMGVSREPRTSPVRGLRGPTPKSCERLDLELGRLADLALEDRCSRQPNRLVDISKRSDVVQLDHICWLLQGGNLD